MRIALPPTLENVEARILLSTTYTESVLGEIGSTMATATTIPLDTSGAVVVQGSISPVGDVDMMRIVATATGKMTATMSGPLDNKLSAYNSKGTLIGYTDKYKVGVAESYSFNVVAGQTYYISAVSANKGTGVYSMGLTTASTTPLPPPPPPTSTTPPVPAGTDYVEWTANPSYIGDTAATALPVTLKSDGTYQLAGSIGLGDTDMIKFTASATGNLMASMAAIPGYGAVSPRIDLMDASGKVLASSVFLGDYNGDGVVTFADYQILETSFTSFTDYQTLEANFGKTVSTTAVVTSGITAGQTYYIKMYSSSGTTGYYQANLTTTVTPPPPTSTTPTVPSGTDYVEWTGSPSDLGDTRAASMPITLHSDGTYQVVGGIGAGADVDVVKFTAPATGTVSVNMKTIAGTLQPKVSLLDINGNVVTLDSNVNGSTATYTGNVTAGQTYYVRMWSANGTTGYFQTNVATQAADIQPPPPPPPPPPSNITGAVPANPTMIDRDGDGYGVNSPLGPDANDADPTVNTYNSVMAKYGTMDAYVQSLGYHPKRIITGVPDAATAQPGDLYLIPGGTYTGNYALALNYLHGTATDPIVVMGMPGQNVIINGAVEGLSAKYSSYLTFDNLTVRGPANGLAYGIIFWNANNLTFNHINESGYMLGFKAMQDLNNITVQNSVFHDNSSSHGVYFGARDLPNSNIYILGNIIYNNNNCGFQTNGRTTNLVMDGNTIYGNNNVGISILEGLSNSTFRNNVVYDNGQGAVTVNVYDDSNTGGIYPYDQTNLTFDHNIFWVGQTGPDGTNRPSLSPAFRINDTTAGQNHLLTVNLTNNVIQTYSGPAVLFSKASFANGSTIKNNIIYSQDSGYVMDIGGARYSFSAMQAYSSNFSGNTFTDPLFKDVSLNYWSTPWKFNFAR